MGGKIRFAKRLMPIPVLVAALMLVQCSLMPDDLEDFFALPIPAVERGAYDVDGLRVSYVRTGNPGGIPVIFIHGSPGSWVDWKLVIDRPRLKDRYDLIAVNRPGWNDQMKPAKVFPDFATQSKLLRPALDLNPSGRSAVLVGHSLGGPIILRLAADYPGKVAGLVLLAPSLDPDLDAVLWYNRLADYKLVKFFLPDMLAKSNDEIMALPDQLRKLGTDMAAVDLPVVLVQGRRDKLVHPDNAAYARRKLTNSPYREVWLPNFGHMIPHFRPAEVVLAIEEAVAMQTQ